MNKGFTLIETVIYTAILGLLLAVAVSSLVLILNLYTRFDVRRDIQDSALTSLDRMTREIRNAASVSTSGSSFGAHPGILVTSVNEGGTPITRQFSLDNGVLHLYEDGADQGPLTSSDVEVVSFILHRGQTSYSEVVRLQLQLQAGNGDNQETKTFYTSTVLRGSYND